MVYFLASQFETDSTPSFDPSTSAVVVDGLDYITSQNTALRLAKFVDSCIDSGICVVGIVRDPAQLESCLRRAGRFDHVIQIPPPDQSRRVALLRFFLGLSGESTSM